nr:hypothetical protein [uncultured bacterium]
MQYFALACDYDGTIATHGTAGPSTLAALRRVRESGHRLLLVTGRRVDDLARVLPDLELFDRIVAENGAVLFRPDRREERLLAEPPSAALVEELRRRGVAPLEIGRCIVATWEPHEVDVLEAIHSAGLELQVSFNKGAVMILPSGINKKSGLCAALADLGLSPLNTVGVGDAENDHAFLSACGFSYAVANALESIKRRVDLVTRSVHGAGVEEIIEDLLADDLERYEGLLRRRYVRLGLDPGGREIALPPDRTRVLVAGASGSGKSQIVTALLERLSRTGYQFCVIDPEGDYESLEYAVTMGDEHACPQPDKVHQLLAKYENAVVTLLSVPLEDRPAVAARLLHMLLEMREAKGRPHWIVFDEAHHMLPAQWRLDREIDQLGSEILVTVHPGSLAPAALAAINVVICVGSEAGQSLTEFFQALRRPAPALPPPPKEEMEALVWFCGRSDQPVLVRIEPSESDRRRHRRKYAEGDLQQKSFFFQGPEGRLNLRAQNLSTFMQIGDGVDIDTWLYHLRRGDYSRWMETSIKDETLANRVRAVEQADLPAEESRARIREAIEERYTAAA